MEPARDPAISIREVSKVFRVGHRAAGTFLAKFADFFSGRGRTRPLSAVREVSLDVAAGEVVGVIGRNGSGKSTLLRLVAGIHHPDAGEISARGQVLYVSGFANGAKPRLTARENIFLAGALFGLTRAEVTGRLDEIVDFSGLGDFLDAKVCQFSSGMVARLNFATFIHCATARPIDVLLVDEVFGAGGDAEFKAKAEGKMAELVRSGAAVLFVSHSLADVEKHCDRAVLLEQGRLVFDGDPREAARRYRERLR